MSQTPNTAMAVIGIDCANSIHGVAFLSWNQHPEPTGSRRATPLLLFQHSAGQSLLHSEPVKGPASACFPANWGGRVGLISVSGHLNAQRFALAAYLAAPAIREFAASRSNDVVIVDGVIGHRAH
jgi:hypothetical protein